ncbi:MAG TPA: MarR family transcriptional regulator [Caproicibacter sp.]|nr:MarR family transcriptional regulator [Caproicibacter sp.]
MKEKSVGMELRCLNHLVRRYVESSAIKQKVDKMTGTNGWIIGYLSEHADQDIYQKDLEQHFSITRSTASRILSLMEQKGLIQRQSVLSDARLKKLVLTQKALEVSEMMKQDAHYLEENLIKGFTNEELDNFYNYIMRMKENIKNLKAESRTDPTKK